MQSFKRFLKVIWEPFEAEFESIEAQFIHHITIVIRLADVEHQNQIYTREVQDKQRQDG